jgi:hypothetical protein
MSIVEVKYQRPNGIVMDSSSWKVSARNPR